MYLGKAWEAWGKKTYCTYFYPQQWITDSSRHIRCWAFDSRWRCAFWRFQVCISLYKVVAISTLIHLLCRGVHINCKHRPQSQFCFCSYYNGWLTHSCNRKKPNSGEKYRSQNWFKWSTTTAYIGIYTSMQEWGWKSVNYYRYKEGCKTLPYTKHQGRNSGSLKWSR